MEDYYKVTITKVTGKTLRFKLTIINPDIVVFPLRNDSALMIICQSVLEIPYGEHFPEELKTNVELLGSHNLAKKLKSKYIQSFMLETKHKFPVPKSVYKLSGDNFREWWENEENLPYGEYTLKVKNEHLISHFRTGQYWMASVSELET